MPGRSANVKYALYKYSTENIGDDIQSIAARRFLPRVDYLIDRDYIGEWRNPNLNEEVKLIANGWYMKNPFYWPPTDSTIRPLLISMYVEPNKVSGKRKDEIPAELFLRKPSKEYLKKFGPVGARDEATMKYFQDNGIQSYFSGCLTLTLQPDKRIRKHDFILAVDIPDELFEFLSQRTERKIIRMSPYGDFYLPEEARFIIAEYFLYLYQSAHAIVTTRLHTALPSLALRTPVVLIKDDDNYDPVRYSGLDNLVRNATVDKYMNDYNLFDLDDPRDNPDRYLKIRQSLIERCAKYTGYDNNKSFMAINPAELVDDENFIATFTDSFSKRLSSMINGWKVDELTYKNGELKKEVDKLRQLNNVLSNNLQKVQDDYTGLIYDYNTIKNTSVKYIIRTAGRKVGAKIRRHK